MRSSTKILVGVVLLTLIVSSMGLTGVNSASHMSPSVNGNISNRYASAGNPANQRMSYFANFTDLNAVTMNESKLYMRQPWDGAYYAGNLYIIGEEQSGNMILVRTNDSLGNPEVIYTFYGISFFGFDSEVTAGNGIYISLLNSSSNTYNLYLYNSTGVHDESSLAPSGLWSLAFTYNFSLKNHLFFVQNIQTGTYLQEYNISTKNYYNYSSQIPSNASIDALFQYGDLIYFSGDVGYNFNGNNGYFPYFGSINTSTGQFVQLSSSSSPDQFESLVPDNVIYSSGSLYIGGVNYTANINSTMYFAKYDISTGKLTNISTGLPPRAAVTQLFSHGSNVWIATYNATDYNTMNYVGLYDLNTTSMNTVNQSSYVSGFFDNLNVLLPNFDYLVGWNYLNSTSELVKFNFSNPSSSMVSYYSDPVGNSYPNYWTGVVSATPLGFVIPGGNGVALENNSLVSAPPSSFQGFFLDSAYIGDNAYVVGQSYAPNDGVFLYQYNLSKNNLTNDTGYFPSSLYNSGSSFVEDAANDSSLILLGVDNETSSANPILYSYSPAGDHASNITGILPANLRSSTMYGSSMIGSSSGVYAMISTSNGLYFGKIGSSYTPIQGIGSDYNAPYSYTYNSFQALTSAGSTIYIAGNNATNGKLILLSYNSTTGIRNYDNLVADYTFDVTSISYSDGTVYLGGYNSSIGSSIPELIAVNMTFLFSQSLSSYIPGYFGNVNSISAMGNNIIVAGGSFSDVQLGLIKISMHTEYPLYFLSSGLPVGTTWSVTVNGVTQTSVGAGITFYEIPGTYQYVIGENQNFYSNISSGSVDVTNLNSGSTVFIGWTRAAYSVVFIEDGLSVGTLWSISLGGKTYSSLTSQISISLENGTYGFTLTPVNGFSGFPSSGSITVAGQQLNIMVYFVQKQGSIWTLSSQEGSELLSSGLFWSGQIASEGNVSVLAGGNGLFTIGDNGNAVTTIENGNNGYFSFVQYAKNSFYAGGNWYVPSGGVNVIRYFPSNGTVQSLNQYLPSEWTSRSMASSLISMSYGGSDLLLIEASATNPNLPAQVGVLVGEKFINLTSQFGTLTYRAFSVYGNGEFLVLSGTGAYLYNESANTTKKVPGTFPIVSDSVDGSNQFGAFLAGNFYFMNGTELARLPHDGTGATNILNLNNPYFVANISGSIYVGNESGKGTQISNLSNGVLNKDSLYISGQVSDSAFANGNFLFSGTNMDSFTPILSSYNALVNLTVNANGLQTNAQWGITFDNITYDTTGSSISVVLPASSGSLKIIPPIGYSTSESVISLGASTLLYTSSVNDVSFSPVVTYPTSFVESGLPAGSNWSLLLDGNTYSSTSRHLNISLPMGSYGYSVFALTNYIPVPSTGTLVVTGSGVAQANISFTNTQTYTVKFQENGLSQGAFWEIVFDGTAMNSTSNIISFTSVGGTHTFSISPVQGYEISVSSGSIDVSSNTTEQVTFFKSNYEVSFEASGVPTGDTWGISMGGNIIQSTGTAISFTVVNGTYQYYVYSPAGYFSNVTSGTIQVSGNSVTEYLSMEKTTEYKINFVESGLPDGSVWNVSINGLNYISNGTNLSVYEPDGTYLYSIASGVINYFPSNSGGSIVVQGSPEAVSVNFTDPPVYSSLSTYKGALIYSDNPAPQTYKLIVSESGITFGSTLNTWGISIGDESFNSSSSSFSIQLTNGIYKYVVREISGYAVSPETGYISISGSQYLNITFIALSEVPVTFFPQGIPFGESVTINVSGIAYSFISTSEMPALTLYLQDGVYQYSVKGSNGYVPVFDSGNFIVSGGQLQINVPFTLESTYQARFVASGLPVGSYMELDLNGNEYLSANGSISLSLPGGVYTYSVGSNTHVEPLSRSGTFQLTAQGYSTDIIFVQQKYVVIFNAIGTGGKPWKVQFGNVTYTTSGSKLQIIAANGSYNYVVSASGSYAHDVNTGTLDVAGNDAIVNVNFVELHTVTFTETGLPAGVKWYVNGTNMENSTFAPGDLAFHLANGNYTFTATNLSLYYTSVHTFSVEVSGSNVTKSLTYSHWSYITGTVAPSGASLTINGQNVPLSSGSFNITVTQGSYSVAVSLSGYVTYYDNFTLSAGSVKSLTIDLKHVSGSPVALSPIDLYALVGIAAAIVAIGVAVALYKRKR